MDLQYGIIFVEELIHLISRTMKRSNTLFLITGMLLASICSCEKNREVEPIQRETLEVDLNNDLINDIKFFYFTYTWDGIGPNGTGMGINGDLIPLNNTMILKRNDIGSLFSPTNDTIKLQMSQPYSWDSNEFSLVSIKTDLNQYVNPWMVNSVEIKDFYYLAFKISTTDKNTLGWMKITIDRFNGLIEIKEIRTSDQGFLILGK
jgi:hypothetical protein